MQAISLFLSRICRGRCCVFFSLCSLLTAFYLSSAFPSYGDTLPRELLTIHSAEGPRVFSVEIAADEAARTQGLMFRRSLPVADGMLFLYARPERVFFWMKNTAIPLDIAFIDKDGRIIRIAADTIPFTEATIASGFPVRAVLEINAGTAARLGIQAGDLVESASLGH